MISENDARHFSITVSYTYLRLLRNNIQQLIKQSKQSDNIINYPSCACGSVETTNHSLLVCPQYIQARRDMITALSTIYVVRV